MQRREDAVREVALQTLNTDAVPEESEPDGYDESASEGEDDELDVTQPRVYGQRTGRIRAQTQRHGYMLDPTCIEDEEDEPTAAAASARN